MAGRDERARDIPGDVGEHRRRDADDPDGSWHPGRLIEPVCDVAAVRAARVYWAVGVPDRCHPRAGAIRRRGDRGHRNPDRGTVQRRVPHAGHAELLPHDGEHPVGDARRCRVDHLGRRHGHVGVGVADVRVSPHPSSHRDARDAGVHVGAGRSTRPPRVVVARRRGDRRPRTRWAHHRGRRVAVPPAGRDASRRNGPDGRRVDQVGQQRRLVQRPHLGAAREGIRRDRGVREGAGRDRRGPPRLLRRRRTDLDGPRQHTARERRRARNVDTRLRRAAHERVRLGPAPSVDARPGEHIPDRRHRLPRNQRNVGVPGPHEDRQHVGRGVGREDQQLPDIGRRPRRGTRLHRQRPCMGSARGEGE